MFGDWSTLIGIGVLTLVGIAGLVGLAIRQRHMQLWLPSYLWPRPDEKSARREAAQRVRSALSSESDAEPVDVFLAI